MSKCAICGKKLKEKDVPIYSRFTKSRYCLKHITGKRGKR